MADLDAIRRAAIAERDHPTTDATVEWINVVTPEAVLDLLAVVDGLRTAPIDVERVKQAITNIAKRHGVVKDPPPPQSLMSIYGYSTSPAEMDAEIAAEYALLPPVKP